MHGGPCAWGTPVGEGPHACPTETATLWAFANGQAVRVEMPGVTTIAHAAMRIAEAQHLDPEPENIRYRLVAIRDRGQFIPDDELAAAWDGQGVHLVVEQTFRRLT